MLTASSCTLKEDCWKCILSDCFEDIVQEIWILFLNSEDKQNKSYICTDWFVNKLNQHAAKYQDCSHVFLLILPVKVKNVPRAKPRSSCGAYQDLIWSKFFTSASERNIFLWWELKSSSSLMPRSRGFGRLPFRVLSNFVLWSLLEDWLIITAINGHYFIWLKARALASKMDLKSSS